jgi:hypothetical protein
MRSLRSGDRRKLRRDIWHGNYKGRPQTALPGCKVEMLFAERSAAVLGSTFRSSSARPTASGAPPTTGPTTSARRRSPPQVFLEGANRANTIFARVPPAQVWVFSERITFYPQDAVVKGSGTTTHAWFVWDKDRRKSSPYTRSPEADLVSARGSRGRRRRRI